MGLGLEINKLLNESFQDLPIPDIRESKVIHFTKIGTHQFSNHEIALIDTPFVQRLKYISQLGLAYNVFPTARHTRFEHSLGVTIMIDKMWRSLNENQQFEFIRSEEDRNQLLIKLRVAAILHDIGHCPFSHVSEEVIRDDPSIRRESDKFSCKPHEAIAYHMIRSDTFRAFFEDLSKFYHISVEPDEISNLIVGKVDCPDEDQYMADMLNGQFDADKLDYIARDSDFSGVTLALGVDRLLLSLGIADTPCYKSTQRKLVLYEKGILPMEQILIAKVMLFSSIYHHQKVRAIDKMVIPLMRRIIERKIEIRGQEISSHLDLLKVDDFDILNLASKDPIICRMCNSIKLRKTFKRSLVISPKTMDKNGNEDYSVPLGKLLELGENPDDVRKISLSLAEYIGNGCSEFNVAIDIPTTPKLGEMTQKVIQIHENFISLSEIFHNGWLESYTANKWKGHIFAEEDCRVSAQKKGKKFLEELFDLKFNKYAEIEAKVNPPYIKQQYTLSDFN